MNKTQSFRTVKPVIQRVRFSKPKFMTVELEDGRIIQVPLSHFSNIERLTPVQRRHHQILDETTLMFDDDDEVYHVQDFLGSYETNAYQSFPRQKLQIDFLAAFRRMLISLGSAENLPVNESLFMRLTDHWEKAHVLPDTLLFHKSPIEAVVFRLQKTDRDSGLNRLQFSDELIAGEVRGEQGLTGFSAKFREQGWVILPAELSAMYKNLFLNILSASVGLEHLYPSRTELLAEAERVALAAMLPENEVCKFFGLRLSKFPDSFRSEVSNYFNLPFDYVSKRANHLGLLYTHNGIEDSNQKDRSNKPVQSSLKHVA